MTEIEKHRLDEQGYLVLENFMGPELLDGLRRRVAELFAEEGGRAGSEFKPEVGCRRLANLVDKGEIFGRLIQLPRLLECIGHVLQPEFKLSSLNVRSVDPFFDQAQPLHADMSAVTDERGYWVCNSIWLLDDFTLENGAIRVVPGSHRRRRLPGDVLADPRAPHPDEALLTAPAGTVVIMNAHMWHGGTGNRTALPRTALHAFFCRRDKPQQQHQKQLLRPEVQDRLSPELRRLLALDDSDNDHLSATATVRSGFLK